MKKQVLASYSGKPGIVRLPSIESANHPTPLCGKIAARSYSLSNPINDNNKGLLTQKRPTSQINRQYPIDQQMMSTIRVDIEKMIELSQSLLRYNHSQLANQAHLQENLSKLQELFLPFLRDAIAFFTSPNSLNEEDKTFITSASVRSSSFSFLQQWKAVISIIDSLNESGISSLFDYVNEQFKIIFRGIETVASKPEKHTILSEIINKGCSILNTSLSNLQNLIKELFENFTDPTSESVSYYFTEVKQFLSLYNESFYNVFPKAGLLPQELASLKSETLSASNDIMSSLRALFSFWPDLKDMIRYEEEIQKLLNSAICQMKLPPSLSRIIAPNPKKKPTQEKEMEKKLKPEFTKVELFISNILKAIDKPPLDHKLDLWKRLKTTENIIIDTIQDLNDTLGKIRGQTHNIQTLLVEADSRKKELERFRAHNDQLFHSNRELQTKLEEVTKISEKRRLKIESLQNKTENLKERRTIEKVSTRLNEMMQNIDPSVQKLEYDIINKDKENDSDDDEDENNLTSLEKMNIFVLEKKCNKCHNYEQQRKEIIKLLSPLITVGQGESLVSAIQSLIKRQEKLEMENSQVKTAFEEKKAELDKVEEATKLLLEKSGIEQSHQLMTKGQGPNSNSNTLLESFRNIEDQYKSDIDSVKTEMNDSHARQLSKIVGMIDNVISDDDDERNYNRKSQRSNSIEKARQEKNKSLFNISGKLYNSENDENEFNSPTSKNRHKSGNDENEFNSEDDEDEFKNIVMKKVKKAASKIETMQMTIDKDNELMEKVKNWMKSHVEGINVDEMDFAESISTLMAAIDSQGNPLQSKVDRLEKDLKKVTNQCRKYVEKLNKMKYVEPVDTSKLNALQLITVAERESIKINKKLESVEVKVDSHNYEVESTRDSMQTLAERLRHLLQLDDQISFNDMDLNGLLREVTNYVEELISGGTRQLFVAVSDLNEMSKLARKNSKFPNSNDPKIYLPGIFDKYTMDDETIRVVKLFDDPLEDIFKNFDFQFASFNLDNEQFKFLREKIFQMHLILGKGKNVIYDKKVNNVMKKFITLSSTLLSYIASSFLGGKEGELNYCQNINFNIS